jgi:lysophospholipase L1-like esterase
MFRILLFPLLILGNLQAQTVSSSMSIRFLALGDSYTIGESVQEKDRWPEQLAVALRAKGKKIEKPQIIAVTGWRTDQLKKAIAEAHLKNEYGLVALLIGVNNQYQGKSAESYRPEFEELLNTAVMLAGGKKEKVFVISIPDYGYTPFGKSKQPTISKEIDQFNKVNKSITLKMGIQYFNITDLTRQGIEKPEYVAADGLHPSGKMYMLWVERIIQSLTF